MITILIPIYNGIEFLDESINSVKNQSFKDWEVLIGINGHEENSEIYIKANTYSNHKIKIFDLYNIKGKSNTLNELIKYSKYDWIALLDVDDKWHHKKLEIQIKHINNYDIIGTNCQYFGDLNIKPKLPLKDINKFNFLNFNPIINSSVLIKKELCNWNQYYDSVEDYDLWLRLRKEKKIFYNTKEILTYHRIHKKSFFNTDNKQEKLLKELKEKYN